MTHSDTLTDLATALTVAQSEMPVIPKTAQGHGYKYADLTVILDTIKPVLKKHGLSVVQSVSGNGKTGITTMLLHKSGQYIADTFELPALDENKRMNAVQAMGAAITYGRRYGLSAMLNLATDEDVDALPNRTGGQENPARNTAQNGGELTGRMKAAAGKLPADRQEYWRGKYKAHHGNEAEIRSLVEEMEKEAAGGFPDEVPDDTGASKAFDGEKDLEIY